MQKYVDKKSLNKIWSVQMFARIVLDMKMIMDLKGFRWTEMFLSISCSVQLQSI